MRNLKYINYALAAALCVFAAVVWPHLPERIPSHFNGRGEVDAWARKGFASWFLLPAIGVVTLVILHASAWAVLRWPGMLNIPSKKQFLELPRAEQEPILRLTESFLHAIGTMILWMFGAIQWATYRAALGYPTRGLMLTVLIVSMVFTPLIAVVLLARTSSMVTEATRKVGRGPGGMAGS